MQVNIIDLNSTIDEIEDFYSLYIESYPDLCIWKDQQIINLADYLSPRSSLKIFLSDMDIVLRELGITIYYTHNDNIITSIAFVEMEPLEKCYVEVKFLCSNQTIKSIADEKSPAAYLLDYIFDVYRNKVILIQPASPGLIPYYTRTRKPSFPFNPDALNESYGYLVFGRLTTLNERCFNKIFRSIKTINNMVQILHFNSLNDIYNNTHDLSSLKDKLITRLDHLVKITKEINPMYYEQILDKIITGIKYYDIGDIIMARRNIPTAIAPSITGGKTKNKKVRRPTRCTASRKCGRPTRCTMRNKKSRKTLNRK